MGFRHPRPKLVWFGRWYILTAKLYANATSLSRDLLRCTGPVAANVSIMVLALFAFASYFADQSQGYPSSSQRSQDRS
jgi:hypothetical protein